MRGAGHRLLDNIQRAIVEMLDIGGLIPVMALRYIAREMYYHSLMARRADETKVMV
jgi:hypothetical protein